MARWGRVPGYYGYSYNKDITFYSIDSNKQQTVNRRELSDVQAPFTDKINLLKMDTLPFAVERNFINQAYDP